MSGLPIVSTLDLALRGDQVARSPALNRLGGSSDQHAVDLWLAEHTVGTRREYARHSARLLAWLGTVQDGLKDCTYDQLRVYFAQLNAPDLLLDHVECFVPLAQQGSLQTTFCD